MSHRIVTMYKGPGCVRKKRICLNIPWYIYLRIDCMTPVDNDRHNSIFYSLF